VPSSKGPRLTVAAHGAKSPLVRRQVKVAPGGEEARMKTGLRLLVSAGGPAVMPVCGAVVNSV
jgi:hypothetical protein